MKFDFKCESNEDLEHFKVLFYRNAGIEQIVYDFYIGNVMARIYTADHNGTQVVTISLFSVVQEGKSISMAQFYPLEDERFKDLDIIKNIWLTSPNKNSAIIYHWVNDDDIETAYKVISELLVTICRVNNLKAFA